MDSHMNGRMHLRLLALFLSISLNTLARAQSMPEQPVVTPNGIGSMPMGANPDVPGIVTPPAVAPRPRIQIIPAAPVSPVEPAAKPEIRMCPCDSTQVPPYTGSPVTRCPCL